MVGLDDHGGLFQVKLFCEQGNILTGDQHSGPEALQKEMH